VASRDRVVWRRRPPQRAAARLGWTSVGAVLVLAPAWLLFGGEPARLENGALNPLALVLPGLSIAFVILVGLPLVALIRRPIVTADHYALTVRPGVVRTLVLPWAQLVELAAVEVDEEPVLLVRCGPRTGSRSADWPRWWDRAELRAARRASRREPIAAYDLAVPMSDFVGRPAALLEALSLYAPAHVTVVSAVG
jgi:hypothetical protein